jgi:hypothetical protein
LAYVLLGEYPRFENLVGKLFLARLNNIIDFSNLDAGLQSLAPV